MSKEYQDINTKQTILEHGQDVSAKFEELLNYLLEASSFNDLNYKYPLPQWLLNHKDILLPIYLKHKDSILTYLLYHDCGKPFCLHIDDDGKRHFPNHAQISKEKFLEYSNDNFIAHLIENDMICHTTKPKDYQTILNIGYIEILLGSALAALHSNAIMFGGFDSDSFKIKFKNLEKLGTRILDSKYEKKSNTSEKTTSLIYIAKENQYEFI